MYGSFSNYVCLKKSPFTFLLIFLLRLQEKSVMGNVTKVLQNMFFIGYDVAKFLLNTGRVLKAIALSKECLNLLNNSALEKEQEFVSLSSIVL